jgi:hypothetical protein
MGEKPLLLFRLKIQFSTAFVLRYDGAAVMISPVTSPRAHPS